MTKIQSQSTGRIAGFARRRPLGWVLVVAAAAITAGAAIGVASLRSRGSANGGIETKEVQRGRLMVTISAEGNLESAKNKELKCQVAGGARIISIVPDGSLVEEGAELVQLDRSAFEQQLSEQQIVHERAIATKIQAEQDFEAAQAAVREYLEGTYTKDLQAAEAQITVARQNLGVDQNTLTHTERMYRKGFVTPLQLEADKFSLERAHLDLETAMLTKAVLEKFTKAKTLKQLEAVRDAADARRSAEQASVNLEKAKLDRIQQQLKHCVIRAPQRGMVVYANSADERRGGASDAPQIEEGAMVRERQTILRLPDLNAMQVRTSIHESRIPFLRPGMSARVKILDHVWNGRIASIANRPAPPQRYSMQSKNYSVYVAIEGNTSGLRPGMSADVELLLADLHDVYTVPVAALVQKRDQFFAWVETPNGPQQRIVTIGRTDDKIIEIKDGLAAGDHVIVNPREVVPQATQFDDFDRQSTEDDSRFKPRHVAPPISSVPAALPKVNHS